MSVRSESASCPGSRRRGRHRHGFRTDDSVAHPRDVPPWQCPAHGRLPSQVQQVARLAGHRGHAPGQQHGRLLPGWRRSVPQERGQHFGLDIPRAGYPVAERRRWVWTVGRSAGQEREEQVRVQSNGARTVPPSLRQG